MLNIHLAFVAIVTIALIYACTRGYTTKVYSMMHTKTPTTEGYSTNVRPLFGRRATNVYLQEQPKQGFFWPEGQFMGIAPSSLAGGRYIDASKNVRADADTAFVDAMNGN